VRAITRAFFIDINNNNITTSRKKMNKIKELTKNAKAAFLKKPWVIAGRIRICNYILKLLEKSWVVAAIPQHHRAKLEVKATIASWTDVEVSPLNKRNVRIVMDNILTLLADDFLDVNLNRVTTKPMFHLRLNLQVAKSMITQLSHIVCVQPLSAVLGQLYMMQHKKGDEGQMVSLEVVQQAVEVTTRELRAGWTIEAMQDIKSLHGIDIEKELLLMASNESVSDIISEVIGDLLRLGKPVDISDKKLVALSDTDSVKAAQHLSLAISCVANDIARVTRRGAGNFVIVPPHVVSILQNGSTSFTPVTESTFRGPNGSQLLHVGYLSGKCIKVYASTMLTDQIIVGYKGNYAEVDGGYFFAPYRPVSNQTTAVNPTTFQPYVSLKTSYSKAINGSLENARGYYSVIKLDSPEPTPV
jgi:hypothetical protein